MRRLFTLISALCLIFSVFIGASMLITQVQPLPEHLAMLHLTDCAPPCWIGIMPGVTTFEQARTQLMKTYGNLPQITLKFSQNVDNQNGFFVHIYSKDQQPQHLFSVSVTTSNNRVTQI